MFTAEEMRKLSGNTKQQRLEKEIERIEERITEAAKKGEVAISLDGAISFDLSEHFRSNGFKISIYNGRYNEQETTINWLE